MSNFSQQFLFDLQGSSTGSTSIPGASLAPDGTNVFYSRKEKGDGYYKSGDGVHTVTYTVSPHFAGTISMQASLSTEPVSTDWFDVTSSSVTYNSQLNSTTTNYVNFVGNFVWVRAKVNRDSGYSAQAVLSVNYNH